MKNFEELECWKRAAELRRRFSEVVKKFPNDEKYKLTDQIIRASRSVTANIAEGFGRYHYQEYAQFCRQSRGSLFELIDHLIVAREEKYISETEFDELKALVESCLVVLNGFINYLVKAKARTNSKLEEPELEYEVDSPLTINE